MEIILNICRENLSYCYQNMKKYRFQLLDLTEHGRLNLSTIERARSKPILSVLAYNI